MITVAQTKSVGLTQSNLRTLVRRGWFTPVARGCYLVPGAARLRARARAALVGRPWAVVYGITAARLHRFAGLDAPADDEPIHLLMPRDAARAQPVRGVRLHWGSSPAGQVVNLAGLPVTSPARTVADLVLTAPGRAEAVALMDAALGSRRLSDLTEAKALTFGRQGSRRVAAWWNLADGRAQSVLETRVRLLLLDHGVTPGEPQYAVIDNGTLVAHVDFGWPDKKVYLEADGARFHGRPDAVLADRYRQNELARRGWRVVRVTWSDLERRPSWIIETIRATLADLPNSL
ncbi:hypothetical protein I6A84_09635 [Frankia sp. CNm7]|uniref:DUF559 domain-containing protein n=2 Tax=Frankia nepalensis TaxID=1836974 RepID=A0A937RGZ1_9ACTN|nr:hypothetical protein [Frankia nepalensis]MBL7513026.1 hypothetical protein [Frankia nepalensis]MBL7518365.1 hypothetical protein [Frankia nepalensis]MBL7630022.1 hypothetical protein [Frankia nepalensis]